jgi:coiled-coil domain-containing protein 12
MASHEALSAAANDRKARLAQLKSLKRKQAPTADDADVESSSLQASDSTALTRTDDSAEDANSTTTKYLSGRNFDPTTRNVKLGFEHTPIADPTQTLEHRASQLAIETRAVQEAEKAEDKGLDLFKLQPKKPNWDLKRDLEIKMRPLKIKTENAIARLVRERIEAQKAAKLAEREKVGKRRGGEEEGEGEEVGMEGSELVEAMRLKEQEEERERRKEEAEEAEDVEEDVEGDGDGDVS